MPQKQNPDVCELVRAKASRVKAAELAVYDLVKGAPSGYNRDLQEAKEPFMEGLAMTRSSLQIMTPMLAETTVNKAALLAGFPRMFFLQIEHLSGLLKECLFEMPIIG